MTFNLQNHFDRAAKDRRHFPRAMQVWAMRHTSKTFENNGIRYIPIGDGTFYMQSLHFTFKDQMNNAFSSCMAMGIACKLPKDDYRNFLEQVRKYRIASKLPN